jgi:hypothetical protein
MALLSPVFSIIKGAITSRQKSHREPGYSWERYQATNLAYSELKRSHELIQ